MCWETSWFRMLARERHRARRGRHPFGPWDDDEVGGSESRSEKRTLWGERGAVRVVVFAVVFWLC